MRSSAAVRPTVPVVGIVLLCSLWIWSGCSEITDPGDATAPSLSLPLVPDPSEPMNSTGADYEIMFLGPEGAYFDPSFFVTPEGTGSDVDLRVWLWDRIDVMAITTIPPEHVRLYLGKTLPDGTFANHLCGDDFVAAVSQIEVPGGGGTLGYQFPIEPYALKGDLGERDYFIEFYYRDQWNQVGPHEELPTLIDWRNVDMNGDGAVNLTDSGFVVEDWHGDDDWWKSDFNIDGAVNNTDLGIFYQRILWGESCE